MIKSIIVNDWLFNMGAVALLRLDYNNEIRVEGNKLDIPISFIEKLPKVLFDYLIENYSRGRTNINWLQKNLTYAISHIEEGDSKQKEAYKNGTDRFLSTLKEAIDKIGKYFEDEKPAATILLENCKKAFKEKNVEDVQKNFEEVKKLLLQKNVDEKITLNYVKAVILAPASGQVSFLNVTKNTLSRDEQQVLFHRDFISPILEEVMLQQLLSTKEDEKIRTYLQQSEYVIAKEWRKTHKKSKTVDHEWFESYSKCAALKKEWGTLPFEEKMFIPLGSTSLNDRWDGQETNIQYISPMARLLLFLSPIGCVTYKKKNGNYEENVFAFLHIEGDCVEAFQRNNEFSKIMRAENSLVAALRGTHEKQLKVEEERKSSTTLVEWYTESKAKKTLLEYRWIEERFYQYVLNDNYIGKVYPYEFRELLVQQYLRNYDTKYLIVNEIFAQLKATASRNLYGVKNALIIRELLMGGNEMSAETTLTERIYATGHSLRIALTIKDGNEDVTDHYKASTDKKLDSIIYRILNAAKSGNRKLFFELVIRLHMAAGRKVSKEFTQCLDRDATNDAKFSTISLAFIAGLMGTNSKEGEKKDGENN